MAFTKILNSTVLSGKVVFKLLRIDQWIKNSYLFLPVFFAGEIFNIDKLLSLFTGFLAFSLIASSVYIINDINDIENDKNHPKNKYRPVASGQINIFIAYVICTVTFYIGLQIGYLLNLSFFFLLLAYFVMNIFYTLKLKQIAILDLFIISTGFLLRLFSGGIVADVPLSHWIIIMVFLLSLFLAIAKRRDDLVLYDKTGTNMRKASINYSLRFVDSCMSMLAGIIIVSYIMYSIDLEIIKRLNTQHIFYTTIFVIAGLMRYLQLTIVENKSGSPSQILLTDKFIQTTIVLWLVSFYILIYI